MIRTAIEIQAFADFDIPYTRCVMTSNNVFNPTDLLNEFFQINGITSTSGLDYRKLTTITDDYIAFLELKDFKMLPTFKTIFSD
jgi:hypothetical protein